MKKFYALLLLIVFVSTASVFFSGCSSSAPFQDVPLSETTVLPLRVYVSGAVEQSGYYFVDVGSNYYAVLEQAGLVAESFVQNANYIVSQSDLHFYVEYVSNGTHYSSINVNGERVLQRKAVNDISEDTICLLADYIAKNGKIHNNADLQKALGNSYNKCFYKFFISEADYEIAD